MVTSSRVAPDAALIEPQRITDSCSSCSSSAPPAMRPGSARSRQISSLAKSPRLRPRLSSKIGRRGNGVVRVVRDEDHAETVVRGCTRVLQHDAYCFTPSADVGSSRISTARAEVHRARAIATTGARHRTTCRRLVDVAQRRCPSSPSPNSSRSPSSSATYCALNGRRALIGSSRGRSCATSTSSGIRARSWNTVAIPAPRTSRGS